MTDDDRVVAIRAYLEGGFPHRVGHNLDALTALESLSTEIQSLREASLAQREVRRELYRDIDDLREALRRHERTA